MFKKTIKYVNFNKREVEEEIYFHLNESEFVEFMQEIKEENTAGMGLIDLIKKAILEEDNVYLANIYKRLIIKAYGEKSEDGSYFMKDEQITNRFKCSAKFDAIYRKIVYTESEATKFLNNIIPAGMKDTENKQNAA